MAKREPKSRFVVTIGVVGRNGNKKGRIEISSGNFAYYRVGAKDVTLKVTQQRLVDILENEIAFEEINVNKYKLPAPREDGDFSIEAWEVDEAEDYYPIIFASSSWRNFDKCKMGVDRGSYQLDQDSFISKKKNKYKWVSHVSVQMAIWIINRYIDTQTLWKKRADYTDEEVVVPKEKMRSVLMYLLKKLG